MIVAAVNARVPAADHDRIMVQSGRRSTMSAMQVTAAQTNRDAPL